MRNPDLICARLNTAKVLLLEPRGLTLEHVQDALSQIGSRGVDDADLYFQHSRNESWQLEDGMVKSGAFSIDQGVGVRAVHGEKTAFAYSDDLSLPSLQQAVQTVSSIRRAGQDAQARVSLKNKLLLNDLYGASNPLESLDSRKKVDLLQKIESLSRARDPRIVQVMAGLSSVWDVVLIARMDGLLVADVRRPLVRLSLTVIAEQNGRRESGSHGGGGRFELSYFDDAMLAHYVEQAVSQALINLESRPAPAGQMSVVLGPGWPGVLLHEAVGHGLEGDFNRKGASAFSGRIGEQVTARGITVVDDGTIADRRGSLNIDDEGEPTQRNVLIEDGVLVSYLQDRLNGRLMGTGSSGSGRRESYAYIPMPRMTNTFMLGGDKDPQEIIASIDRGLYATNFGGGQVDITSGKFVFSASQAWWVEKGKLQYPVKGATLIGNGPQSMKQVSLIGNDLQLDSGIGVCGKEGQSVPVGVGMPTLRIDGLTVGGTGAA